VAVALLGLGLIWTGQAAGEPNFDTSIYPVTAMRYVEEHGLLGQRLMTDDAWGGYVILKYWPRQKVFVDDRYDMYPRPVLEDFLRFSDADRRWREVLDRNRIDVVVWSAKAPVTQLMEADPGWTVVHRDKKAVVFTRAKTQAAAPANPNPPNPPIGGAAPPALDGVVDEFVAAQDVPFSIVARLLPDGPELVRQADRQVLSASLYKLFVARELLRRMEAGTLDRATPAVPTADGKPRTANDCVRDMIVVSDNPCGVWGLGQVGSGRLDATLARDGFRGTSLASPQRTTAADVARFFEQVRDEPELYDLLKAQQVNDRLPRGLPPGTPVAHKTGDRRHWAHDAGIITLPGGNELLLVALSGSWPAPCCDADHPGPAEERAFSAIADLARRVWSAVS
jgi:beta-lactamase class A